MLKKARTRPFFFSETEPYMDLCRYRCQVDTRKATRDANGEARLLVVSAGSIRKVWGGGWRPASARRRVRGIGCCGPFGVERDPFDDAGSLDRPPRPQSHGHRTSRAARTAGTGAELRTSLKPDSNSQSEAPAHRLMGQPPVEMRVGHQG